MSKMQKIFICTLIFACSACSTLNESIQLGAVMGAATGAVATHAAYSDTDVKPNSDRVLTNAAIGMTLGLLTSYITHKEVEKDRYQLKDSSDVYFGDLPPNPFLVPMKQSKGGN